MKKILLGFCFFLGACKLDLMAPVSVSQFYSEKREVVPAQISVEVGTCEERNPTEKIDFQKDRLSEAKAKISDNESDMLKKIKQKIAYIFPTASYQGCVSKMMSGTAEFTLDIPLQHTVGTDEIYFLNNDENFLSVGMNKALRKRIADTREDLGQDLQFNLATKVVNNTKRDFTLMTGMVYVDDVPVITKILTLKPGEERKIRLSDVAIDVLLNPYNEKDAGTASFLWPLSK